MPHEKCPCGKPVGHGRHWGWPPNTGALGYFCECGFETATKRGLEKHLKQAKRELVQQKLIFEK